MSHFAEVNTHSEVNGDKLTEDCSLSSDSVSKDSLGNYNDTEEFTEEAAPVKRKGSYTLETSPNLSVNIRNKDITKPIYVKTDDLSQYNSQRSQDSYSKSSSIPVKLTQSMYERPWISSKKNNSLASAAAKQREEKIRLAKEEQDRRQKQRVALFNETRKMSEEANRRKESEAQRKLDERKQKESDRQKIFEERRQRLKKAELERKSRIMQKLTNQENKHSPQESKSMMTMSCYGGFIGSKAKPGNKEVVKSRFGGIRPVSSTGKIIGFGSSTPRSICENLPKDTKPQKKVPDWLLERLDALSRPSSSRMSERMTTSVMPANSPPLNARSHSERKKLIFNGAANPMTISMIDYSVKPPKKCNRQSSMSDEKSTKSQHSAPHFSRDYSGSLKRPTSKPSNATSNQMAKSMFEDTSKSKSSKASPLPHSSSGTFTKTKSKRSNRTKVDVHLDSDSIDEESVRTSKHRTQFKIDKSYQKANGAVKGDISSDSLENDLVPKKFEPQKDNSIKPEITSVPQKVAKDISEAEYKAKLMENRRLAREKREKEREQQMKAEREKKYTEEVVIKEPAEIVPQVLLEVPAAGNLTSSNDETVEEQLLETECDKEFTTKSQDETIEKTDQVLATSVIADSESENKERNDRKKKLNSIMSRIKKTNEESSSEGGGVSPRRAMSPEPVEMDSEAPDQANNVIFKSSILQSMVNKGKLSGLPKSSMSSQKENCEVKPTEDDTHPVPVLSSVRESFEDSITSITNQNSKSSVAIHSSCADGNSTSDANSDIIADHSPLHPDQINDKISEEISEHDRGICDGKEDSFSINEIADNADNSKGTSNIQKADHNYSSVSSLDTEEDDEIISTNLPTKPSPFNSTNGRHLIEEVEN